MIRLCKPFRSVALKLIVPITAGCILGILILGFAITTLVSARLQNNLVERAKAVAHMVNYTAEADLGIVKLQRIVSALGAEQDIEIITIIAGTRREVIASTRNEWVGKAVDSLPLEIQRLIEHSSVSDSRDQLAHTSRNEFIAYQVPLLLTQRHNDFEQGSVHVVANTSAMRYQARRVVAAILFALTGGIALAAFSLWGLVWSLVLKPINLIADMIRAGERVTAFPIAANDELGMLAESLRVKTLAQEEAESRLEAVNQELVEQNHQILNERRLLDTIVNSVPHAIFWKDRESRYLGCNETFAKAAGLSSAKHIVGLSDFDLPWSKEEAKNYRSCDQQVMRGTQIIFNLEEPQTGPHGEERILLTSKTRLLDDNHDVVGMVGMFNDVTEFKRAEAERDQLLVESAELAQIIRDSPNAVFIFAQSDWRFLVVNQGAARAIGLSEAGMLNLCFLDIQTEFDENSFRALLQPITDSEVSHLEYQTQLQRKTGETFSAQLRLHVTEYRGTPVVVAFASDLTEVQKLERQLSQAQKMESLGQLSAGIAHEINTPMQAVVSNVEFLTQTTAELLGALTLLIEICQRHDVGEPNWRQQVEEISQRRSLEFGVINTPGAIEDIGVAASQVVKIVRAMRAMSHPGKSINEPVDVNQLVRDATILTRNRWKEVATLDLELDENLPHPWGQAATLSQVVLNLIVNATDAIAERKEPSCLGSICIRSYADEASVYLEIEDDGPGIPADIREKVFEPFFTTKDVGKGTGQGLSFSYDVIVRQYGGEIRIESKPTPGCLFVIRVPIVGDSRTKPQPAQASDTSPA